METAIAHNEAKSVEADLALANVLMSIHSRAARSFGIVDMNCNETISADDTVEFTECFPEP